MECMTLANPLGAEMKPRHAECQTFVLLCGVALCRKPTHQSCGLSDLSGASVCCLTESTHFRSCQERNTTGKQFTAVQSSFAQKASCMGHEQQEIDMGSAVYACQSPNIILLQHEYMALTR